MLLCASAALARPAASPAITIIGARLVTHPASPTRLRTARFTWRTIGTVTSTLCRVDKAAYKRCRSGVRYRALAAGTHVFRLVVNGRSGNRHVAVMRKFAWRIDLTPPTAPNVAGGAAAWSGSPVPIAASGSTDPGGALAGYRYRASGNSGATWSAAAAGATDVVSAGGQWLVQFQAVDKAGNASAWTPGVAGPANTAWVDVTGPTLPSLTGATAGWADTASETVTASASTDAQSGLTGYEYETSTDGGATWSAATSADHVDVSAEGATLTRFRAVDGVGNRSKWASAAVQIDRSAPSVPAVTHDSQSWFRAATITPVASGSGDGSGSGVAGYQYETSTDGGTTWSAPAAGASVPVSAEGETLARFAAVDGVGLQSPWTQATVRLDHTAPTDPSVAAGAPGWQNTASVAVTASGSTDAGGSGLAGYVYENMPPGAAGWSGQSAGALDTVTAEGRTLVQMAAVDAAGNRSSWVPATVQIDRTAPTYPTVTGGAAAWKNVASVTVKASHSTDSPGSGVAGYEYETSTDGGATWSGATAGSTLVVSAEGETLVQFHALDVSGLASAWVPATVRIDRTAPTVPNAAGGSAAWQNTALVTISAGGSTDSPGSGFSHYKHRTSTDGGATWSAAANGGSVGVTAEGETLVQFRAVDVSGLQSAWAPAPGTAAATARIDSSAPTAPTVAGGSSTWKSQASETVTASGSTDAVSSIAGYEQRESTDGGATWSAAAAGASDPVTAEGETLVQFRAVDAAGNTSAWAPAAPTGGSRVRLDRTDPTDPTVSGGSPAWQHVASVQVSASGSTDAGGSGPATYRYRTSTNGGATWSAATAGASVTISAQADTLVGFQAVDGAGNASNWVTDQVRLDRAKPTAPTVAGGSLTWKNLASLDVSASGSTDSGGSGLAGYEYRESTDGGATWSAAAAGTPDTVSAEGVTDVQFRALDIAGNVSAWTPAAGAAAGTVKLDRTAPADPTASGGSLAWLSRASSLVSATSSDAGSGVAAVRYQTSTDGGVTWSAVVTSASVNVTAEGQTLVKFQAVDNVGLASGFVTATVRLDRTAPSAPGVAGGNAPAWSNAASVNVTGSGSTDTGGSALAGYERRTSTDGGTTWSAATGGATATISAEGVTVVQFRSVDGAGNASAWTPATPTNASTVQLDRGPPTDPTVSGGSASWSNAASVLVSASGSTDGGSGGVTYEFQTSTNNGVTWLPATPTAGPSTAVSAQGATLVRFRAADAAANHSNWVQATVKLDRTAPVAPISVTGGSLTWSTAASKPISASGASDALSGLLRYEYQTQLNGGAWSAPTAGTPATISAEGTTIVQFRSVDSAGNVSAWTPLTAGSGNTVKLDHTLPTLPTVTGGSLTCMGGRITISASASTDAGGSGFKGYEYEYSKNGGRLTSPVSRSRIQFRYAGIYIVYFRSVDNAGNRSAWAPVAPPGSVAANTACHT